MYQKSFLVYRFRYSDIKPNIFFLEKVVYLSVSELHVQNIYDYPLLNKQFELKTFDCQEFIWPKIGRLPFIHARIPKLTQSDLAKLRHKNV